MGGRFWLNVTEDTRDSTHPQQSLIEGTDRLTETLPNEFP